MSNPITIELRKDQATVIDNESEYTCALSEILNILDGYSFQLQLASIDTQVADTGTIVVSQPIDLQADFSYYEYDLPSFDPSDNFSKKDVSGDGNHKANYSFSAAYTEPTIYQFDELQYECTNFIPNTQGITAYQVAVENASINEYKNVTGRLNYTPPFQPNQVWSPFSIGNIPNLKTREGDIEGRPIYIKSSQPITASINPDSSDLVFKGVRNQQGKTAANNKFHRKVTVTSTIKFFDISGRQQTLKSTQKTDVEDQNNGRYVTFKPSDYITNDGKPWDGLHIGTQLLFSQTSTFDEFISGAGTVKSGDDTDKVKVSKNEVNKFVAISGDRQLIINRANIQIPVGRYEPKSLAKVITRAADTTSILTDLGGINLRYPSNPLLARIDLLKGDRVVFKDLASSPFDASGFIDFCSNCYYYDDADTNRTMGAALFDLEYGLDAESSYELTYAHTPLYNPSEPNTQNIAYFQDTSNGIVHTIPTATGVVFHDLQPSEFWNDTLGFNESNLVVPLLVDNSGIKYYDANSAIKKIPKGAITLDTFTSPLYTRKVPNNISPNPTFFEIEDTLGVIGQIPLPPTKGGYYKLEIIGMGLNSDFINSDENSSNMFAIISTQLDSNNFVTAFSDQGLSYTHIGAPYNISKIKVKITNPDGSPVPTLGNNTSVIIKIIPSNIPEDEEEDENQEASRTNYYS
jgi:hypothetical protein